MTAPNTPVQVDQKDVKVVAPAQKAEVTADQLKADRKEEQAEVKKLEASQADANANDDYFQKVADDDKVFADPYREAARVERQREEDLAKGDPTRDPVAKQAAMDMNTPAPGAIEEAEAIRQGKTSKK